MRWLAAFLLSFLSTAAFAQEQPPELLLDAAHCLATGKQDWFGLTDKKATKLTLGYLVDSKSYPGNKVLYLVSYSKSKRSEGLVFTIVLSHRGGKDNFDIQNNARFVRVAKGGEYDGVSFPDPPLGGEWTQGHIASAIRKIERQPTFAVPVADLLKPFASVRCESYADPNRHK